MDGLCTEKVLLALRSCRRQDSNLNISIKNNGFKNVTMAFYFFWGDEMTGQLHDDYLFKEKEDKSYLLPFDDLEKQYGEIEKIYATPILDENGTVTSCSNKRLPVLIKGCGG